MKAEHRKELKTNSLQAHLTSLMHGLKEPKRRPSPTVWVLVILAVGLVIAWFVYGAHVRHVRADEWTQFALATDASDGADQKLSTLVNESHGTSVALVAQFQQARRLLESGLQNLSSVQRTQAASNLEEARKLYGTIIQKAGDYPVLKQRALLGRAKAEEALIAVPKAPDSKEMRGSLEQAIQDYTAYLNAADSQAPVAQAVKKHVEELKQNPEKVVAFYKELNRVVDTQIPPTGN